MCFHLFVEFGDHHGFDTGQEFGQDQRWHAQRLAECQCRTHIPADHGAGGDAQLAAKASDQIPDLPAVMGERAVQPCGAVFADRFAGLAVARAPTEGPFGKGDETFFSCSSSRPFET